jgi:hypothetical protein
MNGHIYIIEFSGNIIKVGFATNPEERLRTHASDGAALGHSIERSWISSRHASADANEQRLIVFCVGRSSRRHRSEYFSGVSFDEVHDFAKGLDFSPPEPDVEYVTRRDRNRAWRQEILAGVDRGMVREVLTVFGAVVVDGSFDIVTREINNVYSAGAILDSDEKNALRWASLADVVSRLARDGHLTIVDVADDAS